MGLRDDGWTDLGECRWGRVHSPAALASELEGKVRRYPNARQATIGRRLFTRQALGKNRAKRPELRHHTLDDLYALP